MTIRPAAAAHPFTLSAFISTPRPSPLLRSPTNSACTHALFTVSRYDGAVGNDAKEGNNDGAKTGESQETRLLDLETGKSSLVTADEDVKEVVWMDGDGDGGRVLWLRGGKEGKEGRTEVWCGVVGGVGVGEGGAYRIATVPGPAANLTARKISDGVFAVAITGKATPDGRFFDPSTATRGPSSSAREYDRMPARVWDAWVTEEKNAIWYARVEKDNLIGGYGTAGFVNALRGSGLEHPDLLIRDRFALSAEGILFTAADPAVNQAVACKIELYYIPIRSLDQDPTLPPPRKITVPQCDGSALSPTLSPDGKSAAFLRTKHPDADGDRPRIFLMRDVNNVDDIAEVTTGSWDLQPRSLTFGSDGKTLYLTAEDHGRAKLFGIRLPPKEATLTAVPTPITSWGSVSSVHAISPTQLLLTMSSITESSIYAAVDPSSGALREISRHTDYGTSHFAQHPSQVSEISFRGAGPYSVQAFVVKPSYFSPSSGKKYPLLFWIHGGPATAFLDEWSTRWNPAVFAEQGYVVVRPNPTGSTGFGQAFVEDVRGSWGGRPYEDLVRCFDHIATHLDYVDTDRAVAMGASYGGYMINWIAGQPLGTRFRALVCHDGIFSVANQLASDVVCTLASDFRGTLWDRPDGWDKWDPSRHTGNWRTPMLVIHGGIDYRCPISDGLAAFATCQARGVESKFLTFPDEGHFCLKRENSLRWHRVVLGWCDRFCGVVREGHEV